ncbi:MAG: hypothetical protein OQK76_08745 [Gammaproteobacteria bacterium]|nr:hypothetical protein [Gammaproteobacteria bacterium]MCW8910688.1 hypothetical protein [Gammaproteobacteria bacterium]MCW9005751.1 hypothetical protein [Gammaproteobacteria bacterium]MCW9056144.1 hypothetical protein [Gammaproteobacteria bacterium]
MNIAPERQQQVLQVHAGLVVTIVKALNDPSLMPNVEQVLKISEENGWVQLVAAIRKIIKGDRDNSLLNGLDEEDGIIVDAILKGIQNPSTLPDPEQQADPAMAAPMLAQLIHDASRGDANALSMLGSMAEQMSNTQGDLARFSTLLKPLVDGERNTDMLCDKIGPQGESLVVSILAELAKLEAH